MGRASRRKREKRQAAFGNVVAGVAWYEPDQWALVRATAADPERLEPTYKQWVEVFEDAVRDLEQRGLEFKRVPVNAQELIAWCEAEGCPLDGASRAAFTAKKVRERSTTQTREPGGLE